MGEVHKHALTDGSDAALSQQVAELRGGLLRRGLTEALLPRAFALVRETARRTLGMEPYDVQLMAGWAMACGIAADRSHARARNNPRLLSGKLGTPPASAPSAR